jgi:hypothetical protein
VGSSFCEKKIPTNKIKPSSAAARPSRGRKIHRHPGALSHVFTVSAPALVESKNQTLFGNAFWRRGHLCKSNSCFFQSEVVNLVEMNCANPGCSN